MEGAEAWVGLAQVACCRWVDSTGTEKGILVLTKCDFLFPMAGDGEWAALPSKHLCSSRSFSGELSSLMPPIITVKMIRFPAPTPNSRRSLAFPVLTRK